MAKRNFCKNCGLSIHYVNICALGLVTAGILLSPANTKQMYFQAYLALMLMAEVTHLLCWASLGFCCNCSSLVGNLTSGNENAHTSAFLWICDLPAAAQLYVELQTASCPLEGMVLILPPSVPCQSKLLPSVQPAGKEGAVALCPELWPGDGGMGESCSGCPSSSVPLCPCGCATHKYRSRVLQRSIKAGCFFFPVLFAFLRRIPYFQLGFPPALSPFFFSIHIQATLSSAVQQ